MFFSKNGTINVSNLRRIAVAKNAQDQLIIEFKDTIAELNNTIKDLRTMLVLICTNVKRRRENDSSITSLSSWAFILNESI